MSTQETGKWAEHQLTEEQAINFYKSEEWKRWTDEQIVRFQLFQQRLAVPFDRFHEAITKVLGRDVYTHEFMSSNRDAIVLEYLGERQMPTLEEIMNLIPEEKRIELQF